MSDERDRPFRPTLPPHGPREAAELEVEHHIAERVDQLVGQGMEPERAWHEAERAFGDRRRYRAHLVRDESRKRREKGLTRLGRIAAAGIGDAWRTVRRHPGFTSAVVGTLALGIGANAVMFGILDRLMLQPPAHIQEPEQIRRVVVENAVDHRFLGGRRDRDPIIAYPDFVDLKAHSSIVGVAAYRMGEESTLGSGPEARQIRTTHASYDFLPLLGVRPFLGRFFSSDEDRLEANHVVVLSYEFWRRAFGASPSVLGQTIELEGRSTTVIGIAPPRFTGVDLAPVDAWQPLVAGLDEYCFETRNCGVVSAIVRLSPDTDLEAWSAEATSLHHAGRARDIELLRYDPRTRIVLDPLLIARGPEAPAEARVSLWLGGVSLFILLIACANVANLLLTRGLRARRDMAVHLALGLDRTSMIARQTIESVGLALLGGVLGLALADWGGALVSSVLLPDIDFLGSGVNERVLAFSALTAVLAGLVAGAGPAFQSARGDVVDHLRRSGEAGRWSSGHLRALLTGGQIAVSGVLMIGAALFIRSVAETRSLDLGIDVDQVIRVDPELVSGVADRDEIYRRGVERLTALPGVRSVSTEGMRGAVYAVQTETGDTMPVLPGGGPFFHAVSPGHLANIGLSLLSGRDLSLQDGRGDPLAMIVSETMARRVWPDENPLGKCIRRGTSDPCMTVVGVVEDAHTRLSRSERMDYYVPHAQHTMGLARPAAFFARFEGDPSDVIEQVSSTIRTLDPAVRYASVITLRDELDAQARSWTLGASLFTVFGLLALVVASLGLYSLLAFEVAQRSRELGIRAALGAEKKKLLTSVLVRGVGTAAIGLGVGVGIVLTAAPRVEDLLFQVSARDPMSITLVAGSLLVVAALASLIPGLRATRADPMVALRSD
jgi:predicted permease